MDRAMSLTGRITTSRVQSMGASSGSGARVARDVASGQATSLDGRAAADRGPKSVADHTATPMTQAAAKPMTAAPDVASARGPATRIGIRLAALTMDART